MDYPPTHVTHHRHQNHRDDDNNNNNNNNNFPPPPPHIGGAFNPPPPHHNSYGPPPPPQQHDSYGGGYNPPPPQQQQHDSYGGAYNSAAPPHFNSSAAPPPPHVEDQNYPSPPRHQPAYGGGAPETHVQAHGHHGFKPHMPSFHGSQSHENEYQSGGPAYSGLGELENKATSKIHCKAGGDRFVFAIRDGKVLLTHPDSSDPTQQWYKDEKYSTKVKDKEGHPCFMLVNKGTAQAIKHSVSCHPVQLAPYNPDVLDEAVLWSESKDLGSGYRTIRTVNNIHLVMDAWNADKNHGGIHDGTVIALYEAWKGDSQNQQWKFVRH